MSGKGKAHPIPLIHNLTVEVAGDTASANCVMEATVYGTTHKVMGEYHDTFRRVDGAWRFASRTYTIFRGGSSVESRAATAKPTLTHRASPAITLSPKPMPRCAGLL